MSRKGRQDRAGSVVWLRRNELRTWLAYMRLQQRLGYEMNRQLQADSDQSLADYDVLNALGGVPDECMQVGALAARSAGSVAACLITPGEWRAAA